MFQREFDGCWVAGACGDFSTHAEEEERRHLCERPRHEECHIVVLVEIHEHTAQCTAPEIREAHDRRRKTDRLSIETAF